MTPRDPTPGQHKTLTFARVRARFFPRQGAEAAARGGVVVLAALGFRFLLGVVFFLAGLTKLPRRAEFERAVQAYELLPRRAGAIVARWLPPIELAVGTLLFLGVAVAVVEALVALLLLTFAAAVAINLGRGRRIDCGCFSSVAPQTIGWAAVARNISLAVMACVAAYEAQVFELVPIHIGASATVSSSDGFAVLIAATVGALAAVVVPEAHRMWAARARYVRRLEVM